MKILVSIILSTVSLLCDAQNFAYQASPEFPFGRLNPEASEQVADYEAMIGECQCESQNRNPDGTWQDAIPMIWRWKYIMNGLAVQDETLKSDGKNSGSIRQFDADSGQWYVHYYSSLTPSVAPLSYWTGNKEGDKIILYRPQKSPQGTDGFSRLTFYDMSENGYKWIGEWVDTDNTITFPFWKIDCKKVN